MKLTKKDLDGQFVLTQHPQFIPDEWSIQEKGSWLLGTHPSLPVTHIRISNGCHIGWIIGYLITSKGEFCPQEICYLNSNNSNTEFIESVLYQNSGRWIAILFNDHFSRVYLDPSGSLGTVYSLKRPLVASTPSLIDGDDHDWDEEIIRTLRMPNSGLWYPSGLTPKKFVARLLPNHFLDLSSWKSYRHWPQSPNDLAEGETEDLVKKIFNSLKHNISSVANQHPLHLSVTAGRDSRMVLACSLEHRDKILFFTFLRQVQHIDSHIAKLIVNKMGLNHVFLKPEYATNEQLKNWLYRTGYCSSPIGSIGKRHPTLQHLDINRVLLPGVAGEVGRSFYWHKRDKNRRSLDVEELLNRCYIPAYDQILKNTEDWLSELSEFNIYVILDLMYLEQRLGCWSAPQHYGVDNYFIGMLSPFSDRQIFESMLRLPIEYRWRQQLAFDICQMADPELVSLPFNDFTGSLKYPQRILRFANTVVEKARLAMVRPEMRQWFIRSLPSIIRGEQKLIKR